MSTSNSTIGKKTYKVVLLGDSSTGKTSIIDRFVNNKFESRDEPTIGIDFIGKNITYKNIGCRIQLWDTAGQERYRSLIPSYLKDATCAIFVFDANRPESLDNLQGWIDLFKQNRSEKAVMVVCVNKIDLESKYNKTTLKNLSHKYRMSSHEISAKTGQNVDGMFMSIIEQIIVMQQKKKNKIEDDSSLFDPLTTETLQSGQTERQSNQNKVKLTEVESSKKKFCC